MVRARYNMAGVFSFYCDAIREPFYASGKQGENLNNYTCFILIIHYYRGYSIG